ncbi:MAG: hypothetical protein HQK96_19745, partial [Nitrospirae bacterium]|nr:hypothetical protein [Nitrospirota bacterium]
MGKLHLARGRITVSASGYWFTSGGEKGAFGFYPHLKDEVGNAVYPDTQIHGDLRMAAQWLMNLKDESHEEVNKYFGSVPSDKEKHSN